MRKTILSICTAIYTIAICAAENYTEYVNPLMGTIINGIATTPRYLERA